MPEVLRIGPRKHPGRAMGTHQVVGCPARVEERRRSPQRVLAEPRRNHVEGQIERNGVPQRPDGPRVAVDGHRVVQLRPRLGKLGIGDDEVLRLGEHFGGGRRVGCWGGRGRDGLETIPDQLLNDVDLEVSNRDKGHVVRLVPGLVELPQPLRGRRL